MRALGLLVAAIITTATVGEAQMGTKASGTYRPQGVPISAYQRIEPKAHWHAIYFQAIQCSGAHGNIPLFKHVVWLAAPGSSFTPPPTHSGRWALNGLWQGGGGPPDTIVVAREMLNADWLIRHELLHYVLQMDHPESKQEDDDLWGRACQAKRGFLPPDSTPSLPGATTYYGEQ